MYLSPAIGGREDLIIGACRQYIGNSIKINLPA